MGWHFCQPIFYIHTFKVDLDKIWYKDTFTMNDGRVLVYKRPRSKNYQCRLLIPGNTGYIIKSCKTTGLGEASCVVIDLYEKCRFKVVNKLPLETKTFGQIFEDFMAHADKSVYREDLL